MWCNLGAHDAPFSQFGIGPHMLMPGQPNARYHAEAAQEGFLVLSGECIAIVEGEERRMRQWDYLHCPPGTHHITVGAGDGPCVILMVGTRGPDVQETEYTVDELAARYGASVARADQLVQGGLRGSRAQLHRGPGPLAAARLTRAPPVP